MLNNVEWGEFKLGELFEIDSTSGCNIDKLTLGCEYDYVTRTSQNQGISQQTGFIKESTINASGTWSLGLLQMDFFYREKPWYAGQFVRKIIPKIYIPKKSAPFFSVILNRQKHKFLSVLVRDVDKLFLNTTIKMPINNDNNINFDFMEDLISKLEEEKANELNSYLEAAGLTDYALTEEEKNAIANYENIDFAEFYIEDIFKITSSKKRFDANKVSISNNGNPYVVRASTNNGIKGYINEDKKFLNNGNTLAFGQDTSTIFYQNRSYFTGDKIKIMTSTSNLFNKTNAQFIIAAMNKTFSLFSWGGSSFNVKILQNQLIKLPQKDDKPDYKLMETLISAIQKLIIKDVVLYCNEKL